MALKTDYKDDILDTSVNTKRKYRQIDNEDGTFSLEDETVYKQEGSSFGANDINSVTETVNSISDDLADTVPYNLIPFPYYESSHTDNGIDWVVNEDGSVTANGTASITATLICRHRISHDSNALILKAGTYTFTGCPSGGANTKYYANVARTNPTNGSFLAIGNDFGSGVTFTLKEETHIYVGVSIVVGTTVENLTFKPMLVKGDTAKEFRKNFKSVYEMQQYLTGTLTAGETTLIISDDSITEDSMIDIYTNVFGVNPSEVTVENGSITLVFDAQETDLGVKVRVM